MKNAVITGAARFIGLHAVRSMVTKCSAYQIFNLDAPTCKVNPENLKNIKKPQYYYFEKAVKCHKSGYGTYWKIYLIPNCL